MNSYAPGPLPPTVKADVFAIMKEVGVSSLTLKDLRNRLQDKYKVDLFAQKDTLTTIVTNALAHQDFRRDLARSRENLILPKSPDPSLPANPSKKSKGNSKEDRKGKKRPELAIVGGAKETRRDTPSVLGNPLFSESNQVFQNSVVDPQLQHQQVPFTMPQQLRGPYPIHEVYPPGPLPPTVDKDVLAIMQASNINTLTVFDIQSLLTHKYQKDISSQHLLLTSVVSRVLASQEFHNMLQERVAVSSSSSPQPADVRPPIQVIAPSPLTPLAYSAPPSKLDLGHPTGLGHVLVGHADCDRKLDEYQHTIHTLSDRVRKLEKDAVLRDEQYAKMAAQLEAVLSNNALRTPNYEH